MSAPQGVSGSIATLRTVVPTDLSGIAPSPYQIRPTVSTEHLAFTRTLQTGASTTEFPAGWIPVTSDLAARARLGLGLHDATGNFSETEASLERFNVSHQPYNSVSPTRVSAVTDTIREQLNIGEAHGNTERQEISAMIKTFELGDFGAFYHWFGAVAGLAHELGVTPKFDLFFTEVAITVPLTEAGRRLAVYSNQQEIQKGLRKNFSEGLGTGDTQRSLALPKEVLDRVESRADTTFCWCLKQDKISRDTFMSEIFLQWYHRADYLMKRKSKGKKEYRENLTLEEVLKSASQNRRRRVEKREERERLRKEAQSMPSPPAMIAARKRAYEAANSRGSISKPLTRGLAVPNGSPTLAAATAQARQIPVIQPSGRQIGNPALGGSSGDLCDLTIDDDNADANVEDDDLVAQEQDKEENMSFAARIAKGREKKPRDRSSVMEVLPREMREMLDRHTLDEDGMADVRLARGTAVRGSNRIKF
jgi:hypothetical protein